MRTSRVNTRTGASVLVYAIVLAFSVFEQFGRTTSDTKTPLIENPRHFLSGALTLWDPSTNFGQLQNQAYGYLFPQGPFFLLGQGLHAPPWLTERFWTLLILVAGAEGARLLFRSMGLSPWAAWVGGMAYGLNPRVLAQVAVRSAEIVPNAALPWVALPVVLALTGRLQPRRAALLSAVAFMFSGAVNATATVGGLPLIACLLVWGVRRGLVRWSMVGWWSLFVFVTNFWWMSSLLRLRTYSPPFFDFVEDVKATTEVTGYGATLRGLSNWINYTVVGNVASWPAGYSFAFEPLLVIASGLLAAIGVIGLVTWSTPFRAPLVVSAALGLVAVTIAHSSDLQSPLTGAIQSLLDGGFALLRNVSKADPTLRLPLCLGIGAVFAALARRHHARPTRIRALAAVAVVALVLGMLQPAISMRTRTLGWTKVPDYWAQTADYLDEAPGEQSAWLVPGTGFGLQTWGWTIDEPFQAVAKTPWVSRSQIPLAPPQTIRILSTLETFLETGSGSPNLGVALGRLGLGYVIVRHDLDEGASDTTTTNLVAIALARSRGVTRVKTFGNLAFGPAIEVYRVTAGDVAPPLQARPLSAAVTVDSSSADVTEGVADGLIGPRQPAVVAGDDGWKEPAEVVGDTYRDRERDFGRVHQNEGAVRAEGEQKRARRVVQDYPANQASVPVRAEYAAGASFTASSSQAWTSGLGAVDPAVSPYSAFDGDGDSGWRSGYLKPAREQWVEARWPRARPIGEVTVRMPVDDGRFAKVTRVRVQADTKSVRAVVNPFTGLATADLTGTAARALRVSVDRVTGNDQLPVSVLEIGSDSTPVQRTMVIPTGSTTEGPSFVLGAQPETRACISTLLGPDCSSTRLTGSEESSGIDRTFTVPEAGTWDFSGTVVARSRPGTNDLLDPLGTDIVMHASSQWLSDPAVSVRMAYDGATTTSWIADPRDGAPRLTIDWDRPRTISRISVSAPASPAVRPLTAVLTSAEGTRRVQLGQFGQFEPLRTRHVQITFRNSTRGLAPIGIGELNLSPTTVARPLKGDDVTGSVCGIGPVLFVDGRRYDTQVRGLIGDVVSAGPLRMESCSGPIRLTAGQHRFRLGSTEQFQPVRVLLSSSTRSDSTAAGRAITEVTGSQTHQRFDVAAGPAAMLSTTRNINPGWKATLDGKPLATMISDGWAQAWRLPAGAGGTVVIDYAPQPAYLVTLFGGLGVAALVLLVGLLLLAFRTRLAPARPIPSVEAVALPVPRWLALVTGACLLGWVFGGVPALVGVLVGGAVRRPAWLLRLAFVLLVAAPVITAWQLHADGPRLRFDLADALAGVGMVAALMSLVPRPRRR
jgi:arabinofuranan 3-O-arabinosyltransferase